MAQHPNVPVTVVRGPLAMAQILETALLDQLNFPILIATKASRIRQAGRGQVLLEWRDYFFKSRLLPLK